MTTRTDVEHEFVVQSGSETADNSHGEPYEGSENTFERSAPQNQEPEVAFKGDERQSSKPEALFEETLVEEATGNDKKPQNVKQQRIGSNGLEAERQAVYKRLDDDPDESVLAIAIDLDIPEERVLKYMVEWKKKDAKNFVLHTKDVLRVVQQKLKFANGASSECGTPWMLEFAEDYSSVTITLYVKRG